MWQSRCENRTILKGADNMSKTTDMILDFRRHANTQPLRGSQWNVCNLTNIFIQWLTQNWTLKQTMKPVHKGAPVFVLSPHCLNSSPYSIVLLLFYWIDLVCVFGLTAWKPLKNRQSLNVVVGLIGESQLHPGCLYTSSVLNEDFFSFFFLDGGLWSHCV